VADEAVRFTERAPPPTTIATGGDTEELPSSRKATVRAR
jgi:hypothetical protein